MSELSRKEKVIMWVENHTPNFILYPYQRIVHGFDERDMLDPRFKIWKDSVDLIDAFAVYATQSGLRLPDKFEEDPAAWQQIIKKIQHSFLSLRGDKDMVTTEEEAKDIQEGFELFGKYFLELWERKRS